MISLTDRPGAGPRGGVPFLIKLASHCGKNALQKSSTAQKVSTSRSNMLTSHDMIGSAQFLESLIHKALMPPIPVIGVTLGSRDMWWLWPHLRRLWAAAGTVSAGLAVNYLYGWLENKPAPA